MTGATSPNAVRSGVQHIEGEFSTGVEGREPLTKFVAIRGEKVFINPPFDFNYPMRYALHIVLVLLLVSAGCIGNGDSPASSSVTTTTHNTSDTDSDTVTTTKHTPSSDPVTPANLTSSGIACDDDLWVGLWELNNEDVWDPDVVRVGYYTPPNSSFLLVAYVDGNVAGVNQIENQYDSGEHVDGDKIMLDSPLSGKHWVQVVAFSDENTNGQFDQGVDKACLIDGELVQTDSYLIDFSRL